MSETDALPPVSELRISEPVEGFRTSSGPTTRRGNSWIVYIPTVLAVLALGISATAWFFAYRADVVDLGGLSGLNQSEANLAQVEELQRANDRILNTAWAALGIVVTLATVLVTFNFVRTDRVIEREREIAQQDFGRKVNDGVARLSIRLERIEDAQSGLRSRMDSLETEIAEERRARARAEFLLYRTQEWIHRIDMARTGSNEPLPLSFSRSYNRRATAAEFLRTALESEDTALIGRAVEVVQIEAEVLYQWDNDSLPRSQIDLMLDKLPKEFESEKRAIRQAFWRQERYDSGESV